jgi:hypothetical protein
MMLPPREDWDQRGMFLYFMFCDFDSVAYDYVYMYVDSTFGVGLQMWGPKAVRQIWLGIQLARDQCDHYG